MGPAKDRMFRAVDVLGFGRRRAAPKDEHPRPRPVRHRTQRRIRQRFPPPARMRPRTTRLHREHIVQQQNALLSPERQVPGRRLQRMHRTPAVRGRLLQDIAQRRRMWTACLYRKGQTVRLAQSVVRILPYNDHPHRLYRRAGKGMEHRLIGRVAGRISERGPAAVHHFLHILSKVG